MDNTYAPRPTQNALTIDVEDYYHVSGFSAAVKRRRWEDYQPRIEYATNLILETLADRQNTATFFVLGWAARRMQRLLRSIVGAGHEIGCHSYWHQLVYQQTPRTFGRDLRLAKRALEDAAGVSPVAFRAPSFS